MVIKYIAVALILCLSVLGLAELLHGINLRLASPHRKAVTYSVVLLKGEDAEQQLIFAIERQKWLGNVYSDYIVAVNNGLNEKSDKACRYIAEKYGAFYLDLYEFKKKVEELK